MSFESFKNKALGEMKFIHITSGARVEFGSDKLISKASSGFMAFIGQNVL